MVDGTLTENRRSDDPPPDEVAGRNEQAARVRRAVDSLPDDQRAALTLVRFNGMKYREAADVLGVTLETIRMRVHRAHLALVPLLTQVTGAGQ